MRQFHLAYPKVNAPRSQLTWMHYRTLMRLPDEQRAFYYERLTMTGRWGSRELDKQINSLLYERTLLSSQPADLVPSLPSPRTERRRRPTRSSATLTCGISWA